MMKNINRGLVTIVMYALLYSGASYDLWPLISHFNHNDAHIPAWIDIVVNSVLLPLAIAYLLAATSRLRLSPWPLLLAPFLLLVVTRYLQDAFSHPYSVELISLLGIGAVHGICAVGGWFVYERFTAGRFTTASKPELTSSY